MINDKPMMQSMMGERIWKLMKVDQEEFKRKLEITSFELIQAGR